MEHIITRQELYNRVWQTPMRKLAQEYGLSDRGLAKLCKRHNIPSPTRGYWVAQNSGQAIGPPPPLPAGENITIRIQARPKPDPEEAGVPPSLPVEIQQRMHAETKSNNKIILAKTLRGLHPILAKLIQSQTRNIFGDPLRSHTKPTLLEQYRLRVLSTLFKALEARGFAVERPSHAYERRFKINWEQDSLYLSVEERIQQTRHRLTNEERKKDLYQNYNFKYERHHTGLLRIRLDATERGSPLKDFDERAPGTIGEDLNSVIAGTVEQFWLCKQDRLAYEARQKRWREEEQEYVRIKALETKAVQRLEKLENQAQDWQRAQTLRAYIAAVMTAQADGTLSLPSDDLARWHSWAAAYVHRLDPITAGSVLEPFEDCPLPEKLFPRKSS